MSIDLLSLAIIRRLNISCCTYEHSDLMHEWTYCFFNAHSCNYNDFIVVIDRKRVCCYHSENNSEVIHIYKEFFFQVHYLIHSFFFFWAALAKREETVAEHEIVKVITETEIFTEPDTVNLSL